MSARPHAGTLRVKLKQKVKTEIKVPDQNALDEVFPNNPIKQVAFEVRFHRNLKVLRDIGEMQDQLGPQFSYSGREEILFPREPTALSYGFVHSNGTLIVKAGEDRFAVLATKYDNFELFLAEVMQWTSRFCSLFHITNFNRVGLRYINNITIQHDANSISLQRYVNPYVDLARIEPANLKQFSVELLTEKPDCKFNTRSAFNSNPLSAEGIYILDLDAFIETATVLDDLARVLELLHCQSQIEFLTHITEEYKKIMRRKK